jgi:Fur family ferric uptake transcriptional regulator
MKDVAQKNLRLLLRKSGYKATAPRLSVLDVLAKEKNPLSAQDIIDALGKRVDQATVYRILKTLKTKGLIRQIDFRHNPAHYELAGIDEHHHLVCVHCGRIEDVHDCGVEETHSLVLRHSKHFAEIKQHALEFYGACKSCAKKQS